MHLKKYLRLQQKLDWKREDLLNEPRLITKDDDPKYKEVVDFVYYSKTKKLLDKYFEIDEVF